MSTFVWVVLGFIITIIIAFLGLFTEKGLPYLTLLISIILAVSGWKEFEKYRKRISIVLFIIAVAAVCIGANIDKIRDGSPNGLSSSPNGLSSSPDDSSSSLDDSSSSPDDSSSSPDDSSSSLDDSSSSLDDSSSSLDDSSSSPVNNELSPIIFPSPDEIGADSEYGGERYFPILDMLEYQHIFITLSKEPLDLDAKSIIENIASTLENISDTQLKDYVENIFISTCQSVQNSQKEKVDADPTIGKLVEQAREVDEKLSLAQTNNESKVELYARLAKCYEEMAKIAPRGNIYLQLARPYEEQIVYMRRESDEEKDDVFKSGAKAVAAFRTSQTYEGDCGDTDADLFYRIAKIYHYLGDTSNLNIETRIYLYRISISYLELAGEYENESDTYYGYIAYHRAIVYHKLAIQIDDCEKERNYYDKALKDYRKADDQKKFNDSTEENIKKSIENIKIVIGT